MTRRAGLRTCTLDGSTCSDAGTTVDAAVTADVLSLSADDRAVFLATSLAVAAVDRGASATRSVALVGTSPGAPLLEDATSLYVTTKTGIVRVPKAGGAPLMLAEVADVAAVALDEANVYFVDPARSALLRVAK